MYRLQNEDTGGIRGLRYDEGYDYINSHRNTGVYYVSGQEDENTKMGTNIEHVFFGTVSKDPFSSVQFIPIDFLRSPGSTGL